MTERAMPLPAPPAAAAHLRVVPAAPVTARAATLPKRPVHVAVTVGVVAGVYAVSLAGVTALQATTDARLAAERAPAAEAVAALRAAHDATEAELARLEAAYAEAAGAYAQVVTRIGAHEESLAALGADVEAVEGSTAGLRVPTVRLPSLRVSAPAVAGRPRTNACTTASGQPC